MHADAPRALRTRNRSPRQTAIQAVLLAWVVAGTVVSAAGCFKPQGPATVEASAGHGWTGTGRMSLGARPFATGLAAHDLFASPELSRLLTPAQGSQPLFTEEYALDSVAQTVAESGYEVTWVHARVDGRDDLTLFHATGVHLAQFTPVPAMIDTAIVDRGRSYIVREICDLAALEAPAGQVNGGQLFLSLIACTGEDRSDCVGGIAEVRFSATRTPEWSVLNVGRQQATVRDHRDRAFAADCMPITVAPRRDFRAHYLGVAHPHGGDILLYEIGKLDQAPVAVRHVTKAGSSMGDLVMLRHQEDAVHLTALWRGDTTVLESYTVFQGEFTQETRSTEPAARSTLFIESPGSAAVPTSATREIFAYGPDGVVRYEYELAHRL